MNDLVKRADEALKDVTPGPWRIKDCETYGDRCKTFYQEIWNDETDVLVTTEVTRAHNDGGRKNLRFIAAARELVPLMRDRIEADAKRIAELKKADMEAREFAETCNSLMRKAQRDHEAAEARVKELAVALREMRDDKTGYRHAVHFRRRIATILAALEGEK